MLKIIIVIIAVLLVGCVDERQVVVVCGNITLDKEQLLEGKCNKTIPIECTNFDDWESLTPPYMPRPASAH